jgi:phosphatidate phosphatase APP1
MSLEVAGRVRLLWNRGIAGMRGLVVLGFRGIVRLALGWAGLAGVLGCSGEVASDERVVLFDTSARLVGGEVAMWEVPIHGWVYEPADSRVRKSALAALLKAEFGLEASEATKANFDRRVNLFLADNERGKRISVQVAGTEIPLPASGPNGHFEFDASITLADVEEAVGAAQTLRMVPNPGGASERKLASDVHLTAPHGITVVSDIDDTVKVSEVHDRRALLDNTFFQDFRPVPGMALKYAEWARQGASFHFVSSSPWQLYEPLREFLVAAQFPPAVLHLKSVRLKDETLLDLFKPGTETKPKQIAPILRRFPSRQFVLVGDSGEQDPEVYAALLKEHPEQILRAYIRNVTHATPADARFGPLFAGVPRAKWALFTDPKSLELPSLD